MKLTFQVQTADYTEDICLHKADNGHFDLRTLERLGRYGEDVMWDLLGMLDTEEWHQAWANADIKPNQEIMILDRMLGIAVPIVPEYTEVTNFYVKTVGDISERKFSIHDKSYVFEWNQNGEISQYTYEKPATKNTYTLRKSHPRIRACVYA